MEDFKFQYREKVEKQGVLFFKGVCAFLYFIIFAILCQAWPKLKESKNTSSHTAIVSEAAQEDLEEHRDVHGAEEGEGEGRRRQDQQRGHARGRIARKGKRSTETISSCFSLDREGHKLIVILSEGCKKLVGTDVTTSTVPRERRGSWTTSEGTEREEGRLRSDWRTTATGTCGGRSLQPTRSITTRRTACGEPDKVGNRDLECSH